MGMEAVVRPTTAVSCAAKLGRQLVGTVTALLGRESFTLENASSTKLRELPQE